MALLVNLSGRGDKDVESVIAWDREHSGERQREAELLLHPAVHRWRNLPAGAEEDDEP
jgi:hypothetical protein